MTSDLQPRPGHRPGFPRERHDALRSAEHHAQTIAGMICVAHALASQGRSIDLSGLERDVGMLCARVLDLAPAQGRLLRGRLVSLLQALDSLADTLRSPAPTG